MCAFGWYCIINRRFAADGNRVATFSSFQLSPRWNFPRKLSNYSDPSPSWLPMPTLNVMAMTSVGLFREPWMLTDIPCS